MSTNIQHLIKCAEGETGAVVEVILEPYGITIREKRFESYQFGIRLGLDANGSMMLHVWDQKTPICEPPTVSICLNGHPMRPEEMCELEEKRERLRQRDYLVERQWEEGMSPEVAILVKKLMQH